MGAAAKYPATASNCSPFKGTVRKITRAGGKKTAARAMDAEISTAKISFTLRKGLMPKMVFSSLRHSNTWMSWANTRAKNAPVRARARSPVW